MAQVPRIRTPTDRAGIKKAIICALFVVGIPLEVPPEEKCIDNMVCGLCAMLWGEHANGRGIYNGNLGNIDFRKDWGWTGDVYPLTAREGKHSDNKYVTKLLVAPGTIEEGAKYYIKILGEHYPGVLELFSAGKWEDAIKLLKSKSYFTAPLYGKEGYFTLFMSLVREYKRMALSDE